MSASISPPSHQTRLARQLLESAPVLRGNPTIANYLSRPVIDFQRLAGFGFWSSGERLVVEAAAAIARAPGNGAEPDIDWAELRGRLDHGNLDAVASIASQL